MLALGTAPIVLVISFPSLNATRVGMLITPKEEASSFCSSTFTFHTLMSGFSSAIWSTIGDTILQGPHQDAQKSRSTGLLDSIISLLKFSDVIFNADILISPFKFYNWFSVFLA